MLKRLRVKNFKSLRNLDLELRQRNVFIGRNNSGKSSILPALSYLNRTLSSPNIGDVFQGPLRFQHHLWKGVRGGSISFESWGDDRPTDVQPLPFYYELSLATDFQGVPT